MRNTGLILENNIKDYIFLGSNSRVDNQIIFQDGNWSKYKVSNERQAKRFMDTWNCVAFSACNVIEIFFNYLLKNNKISKLNLEWLDSHGYLINGELNVSDRFVGSMAGTKVGVGNTGSKVANAIHTNGLVPELVWPFSEKMQEEEYYSNVPQKIKDIGIEFTKRFDIPFEVFWLANVEEALRYSPVQVYVNAWYFDKNKKLYYNPKTTVNHAVARIKNETEQIFDSYDPFIKSLTRDYYYHPTGYKYTVLELVNNMNIEQFLKENDLLFVRNKKTGQFGRIMQGELKTVETDDRGTLMLLDNAVRINGRQLTNEEWEILPKTKF